MTIAVFSMADVELSKNVEEFQDCYLLLLGYKLMILMRSEQAFAAKMSHDRSEGTVEGYISKREQSPQQLLGND